MSHGKDLLKTTMTPTGPFYLDFERNTLLFNDTSALSSFLDVHIRSHTPNPLQHLALRAPVNDAWVFTSAMLKLATLHASFGDSLEEITLRGGHGGPDGSLAQENGLSENLWACGVGWFGLAGWSVLCAG